MYDKLRLYNIVIILQCYGSSTSLRPSKSFFNRFRQCLNATSPREVLSLGMEDVLARKEVKSNVSGETLLYKYKTSGKKCQERLPRFHIHCQSLYDLIQLVQFNWSPLM